MQLNLAEHRYSNVLEPILNPIEVTIPHNDRVLMRTNSLLYPENAVTGILQPSDFLHEEGVITFRPALVTLNEGKIQIPVNNFTDHPYKLKKGLNIANFPVMTPEQMKYVKPVGLISTWHILQKDQEQAAHYVSSLIKTNKNMQSLKTTGSRELQALQDLETLNLSKNEDSGTKCLANFEWKDSTLAPGEIERRITSGIP